MSLSNVKKNLVRSSPIERFKAQKVGQVTLQRQGIDAERQLILVQSYNPVCAMDQVVPMVTLATNVEKLDSVLFLGDFRTEL